MFNYSFPCLTQYSMYTWCIEIFFSTQAKYVYPWSLQMQAIFSVNFMKSWHNIDYAGISETWGSFVKISSIWQIQCTFTVYLTNTCAFQYSCFVLYFHMYIVSLYIINLFIQKNISFLFWFITFLWLDN